MFMEIGLRLDNAICGVFRWNRRRKWYKTYCCIKCKSESIDNIKTLYCAGYITEKHFKRLAKRHLSQQETEKTINRHNGILDTLIR